ncbi:hypothetical protein Taro_044810 [Colocasia esculenta]|uniref:Uncharacterized protein n=1 Tax=Colocasia esculenta TaxID=4460 RepID=A0A843X3B1_COLES|nr:hypothetical protein [Colocasia esculenta]
MDDIKPSHVGLEQEAQLVRGWKGSLNGVNGRRGRNGNVQCLPPIKFQQNMQSYMHIDAYSI